MGWRSVVITQHAKISYTMNQLLIQTDQDKYKIPVTDIKLLLINTTQAVITTAAICALAEKHAKVIFTDRQGEPITETVNYYSTRQTADLIRQQVMWSKQKIEVLWTKNIASKINNQIQVIDFVGGNSNVLEAELDKLEMNDATNREAVVANKYFTLLFGDQFYRRNFTPINAALNYGYAILLSTINREIVVNGYLTSIGIHHNSNENDFNLGSDLMEPFRPVVDQWVSQQKFDEFTSNVKFGLVSLMTIEVIFNGQKMLLENAMAKHVANCCLFLSGKKSEIEIEMRLPVEVSSNAFNDHV